MTNENFSKAINNIDNDLIDKAINTKKRNNKIKMLKYGSAAAVFIVVIAVALIFGGPAFNKKPAASPSVPGTTLAAFKNARSLTTAVYPVAAKYPDESDSNFENAFSLWSNDSTARRDATDKLIGADDFYKTSIKEFLSGSDSENRVYSPVNVYMALAMLSEVTDSNSRAQIFDLLGVNSIEEMRTQAEYMWRANYRNDGLTTSVLANSFWLNENIDYNSQTLNTLAEKYFASSFSGDTASEDMTALLRAWLNEQTGGLLKDSVDNIKLSPDTVLALCSTVYFNAKWDHWFNKNNNISGIFHAPNGDMKTTFMQSDALHNYYWGDNYGAVNLRFADKGSMWLILPDEGKTTDDVLSDGEYMDMIKCEYDWEKQKYISVNLSVPKFDVSGETNLKEGLCALGITDIFDSSTADFSPLVSDAHGLYVSEAKHAARVVIDEDGCTASALTAMMVAGGAMPPTDEIDFVLDRPFIFIIQSDTGHTLFAGVVNRP